MSILFSEQHFLWKNYSSQIPGHSGWDTRPGFPGGKGVGPNTGQPRYLILRGHVADPSVSTRGRGECTDGSGCPSSLLSSDLLCWENVKLGQRKATEFGQRAARSRHKQESPEQSAGEMDGLTAAGTTSLSAGPEAPAPAGPSSCPATISASLPTAQASEFPCLPKEV